MGGVKDILIMLLCVLRYRVTHVALCVQYRLCTVTGHLCDTREGGLGIRSNINEQRSFRDPTSSQVSDL